MAQDKYAIRIQEAINKFGAGPKVTPSLDMSGETPNHTEERFCGGYGNSPDSFRSVIVDWYGKGIQQRGNRAKNSTDESLFSVSHDAHYLTARGPLLLFGLKAGHQDIVDTMVNVWKGDLAAFVMVSTPDQKNYACPCARLLDGADQRKQVIDTFRWLQGKKIHQPKTISFAPDWLGLYAFQLIEKAFNDKSQPWARQWPDIKQEITSGTSKDILPLKNPLVVERSSQGHRAYFKTFNNLGKTVAKWAWVDYNKPDRVIYGVDDPTEKNLLKGVELLAADKMPPLIGPSVKTFNFPVAKPANQA